MLTLSKSSPFASGGNRDCYVHPLNPERCLKVIKKIRSPELRRAEKSFPANLRSLDSFNENSLKDEQERWKEIDYLYAKTITIEVVDKQITGINKGITSDGELILEVDSKRIKIITGHIVV